MHVKIVSRFAVALLWLSTQCAQSEPPQIGRGDKLRIDILGGGLEAQVLSGEFRVDDEGNIDYPLLGAMGVVGKAPKQVGSDIQNALGDNVKLVIAPSVTISEFAPVFLLGNISKPGSYSFQPDLTVLKLVLSAGGLPSASGSDGEARLRAALREQAELQLNQYSLQVERARLLAQIKGGEFSPQTIAKPQQVQADAIVANEIESFSAWQRSRQSQAKAYEA